MSTTYTFDVFSTLDGFGSYGAGGDWGGYWSKQGPEFLEHRRSQYEPDQRMVMGADTFREFVRMIGSTDVSEMDDWTARMRDLPTTVVSSTLDRADGWPHATVVGGDAADVVARLKDDSDVPLRSHGSLSLNRALATAGLVDIVQVTVFPVISGRTGTAPILAGWDDFDLELVDSRTMDGRIQELRYRPTRR